MIDPLTAGADVALDDAVRITRFNTHRPCETNAVAPVPRIDELALPDAMTCRAGYFLSVAIGSAAVMGPI